MTKLEKIERDIEIAEEKYNEIFSNSQVYPTLDKYLEAIEPYREVLAALSRKKRLIMPYELDDMPDYGDVMSLNDFIETVRDGGFIDYDGSGNYVKDGKMSNIDIYPSDVEYGAIRKDFDTIIWFNR